MLSVVILVLVTSALVSPISSKSLFKDKDDVQYYPEWLCKQICEQSKGKSEFNNTTLICYCRVKDLEKSEVNWERLKHKAKFVGLHLEVSDLKSKKVKRAIGRTKLNHFKKPNAIEVQNVTETITEKIKKIIDTNTENVTPPNKRKLVIRSRPRLLLAKHRQNQNQEQINKNQITEQQTNTETDKPKVPCKHEELRRKIKERREQLRKRREYRLRKNAK